VVEVLEAVTRLFIETGGLNYAGSNNVRIDVGGRSAILEVTLALGSAGSGNTDGGTTISNTRAELSDGGSLVLAS